MIAPRLLRFPPSVASGFVKSKPKQLPERKLMTIAAGFVCHDGIVLCADSQESYGDYKWPVKKLAIPRTHIHPIMIAGSGFGPAIDTATQKILEKVAMSGANHEQVLRSIETILREIHKEDLPYYPIDSSHMEELAFELLIAFRTADGGGLYRSSGSLLKRVDHFEIIGSGAITNFLRILSIERTLSIDQLPRFRRDRS
jgi:hypothetical protein